MIVNGRYRESQERVHRARDGAVVRYLSPRIIPLDNPTVAGRTVEVAPGEEHRPDLLAFRALKNPLLAYRIADVNGALDVMSLCDRAGRTWKVPGPDLGSAG